MLPKMRLLKTPSAGSAMSRILGRFILKMGRRGFHDDLRLTEAIMAGAGT
jgi:hypothetical protein